MFSWRSSIVRCARGNLSAHCVTRPLLTPLRQSARAASHARGRAGGAGPRGGGGAERSCGATAEQDRRGGEFALVCLIANKDDSAESAGGRQGERRWSAAAHHAPLVRERQSNRSPAGQWTPDTQTDPQAVPLRVTVISETVGSHCRGCCC